MATGSPRNTFSGGEEANRYLEQRGFRVAPLELSDEPHVWWVNQGKSYDAAKAGGFISAPLAAKSGLAPWHWATLAEVKPGDLLVHRFGG